MFLCCDLSLYVFVTHEKLSCCKAAPNGNPCLPSQSAFVAFVFLAVVRDQSYLEVCDYKAQPADG